MGQEGTGTDWRGRGRKGGERIKFNLKGKFMTTVELNKIIAVEPSIKSRTFSEWTKLNNQAMKAALLMGIARTYSPLDEDGERFPDEQTQVQVRIEEILKRVAEVRGRLFDVVATKDWGNTIATADVKLRDGSVLLPRVPVTHLLFWEKELDVLHGFVKDLPTLDPARSWRLNEATNSYATDPEQTNKSKKVPQKFVKWQPPSADYKQEAQVDVWQEDKVVGHWTTIHYSGAIPATRKRELLDRVETLQEAVKFAREDANRTEVEQQKVGKMVFDYLFA